MSERMCNWSDYWVGPETPEKIEFVNAIREAFTNYKGFSARGLSEYYGFPQLTFYDLVQGRNCVFLFNDFKQGVKHIDLIRKHFDEWNEARDRVDSGEEIAHNWEDYGINEADPEKPFVMRLVIGPLD